MKRILTLQIFVFLCIIRTYHLSRVKPKEGLFVFTILIVRNTALPGYFYEMMDDFDDVNSKYDIFMTTHSLGIFKPTTTTTEAPVKDEWRIRGEFRVKCVDEVRVGPKKVVRLMSMGDWDGPDDELKMWVLCVLHKMNLMSMEGVFKMDVAMSKILKRDREDAESLIDYCLPKKPMAPHEIAWEYVKCHSTAKGNFSALSIF